MGHPGGSFRQKDWSHERATGHSVGSAVAASRVAGRYESNQRSQVRSA